jgi:hypothetical protein
VAERVVTPLLMRAYGCDGANGGAAGENRPLLATFDYYGAD